MAYTGERTVGAIVAARAAEQPDRPVLRVDSVTFTYARLDHDANRVANALLGLGLAGGDKVAVMLSNRPEFVQVWFGVSRAGLVEVPVNTAYKGDLLAYLLNQAECRVLVIDALWLDRLAAVRSELTTLRHLLVVGASGPAPALDGLQTVPWDDLLAGAAGRPPAVTPSPNSPAAIMFTSGTTGPSKGAVLTDSANFRHARHVGEIMGYGRGDVQLNSFPLFHSNARYSGVLAAMIADAETIVQPRFSASGFWDTCRAHGVTAFNYMGAAVTMLHKQPERPDDADNPVRRAFGAAAPAGIFADFQRRFGLRLVEVYGSTEGGTVTTSTVEDHRTGSTGRPVPYFDVEVHDEHDEPCPPGVAGEIVVRPREPYVLFSEYYRMPGATVAAFRNLWFHTGDRGRTDADGWFYYVDRIKDAIRRRGENISSWEVEQVVTGHDDVVESAAVGVPSELTEEEVLVVVVARPGRSPSPESLLDHCQERLPHYAVPRYVRFVDALPKTASERIEKYRLRADGVTADTWDREQHGYLVRR